MFVVRAFHRLTQITPCTTARGKKTNDVMRYTFHKVHFLFLGKTSTWADTVKSVKGGQSRKGFWVSEALI